MSFRLSSAQKRKKTATKVADVTRRQTKISEYFAKSDCAKFSETKEIMTSEPECVYLSSSDEEVPNKQPRLSDATSVQWTGKLRSVQKKPIQSSITTCLGKNNTECDVSVGTSKRRLTINRKNTDTAVASSSSSSREDSGSPCQSSISKFISSCEAFLTPSTEKIRKKLHKLYGLSPNLKEEIGKFIVTVCPIRRENVFTKIKMVLDEVRKCEASAENGEKTPKEAELLPPLDEVLESKLKKMDKAMTRIHSKIKELREREVDLDDEDNSCYLLEERLTQKFLKIHGMYCKLQGAPAKFKSSKIRFEGSKYPGLNQAIQTFLIKRKEAPDFADILKIVKSFNSQLKLNDSLLQQLAQDCFKKSVEVMKLARVGQHWDSLHGYVDDTPTSIPDQLTKDEELQRKLQENMKLGEENLEKVLNAYATQQEDLKLEPEEYDSGEESPNDDEDGEGTNAIGDKESEDGNSDILILEEEEENELKTEKAKDKCFAEEDKIWKNKDKLELVDALELEPTVESRPTKVLTDSEECKDILNISDEEDDVTFIHQAEHQSSDFVLCVSEDDADSEL